MRRRGVGRPVRPSLVGTAARTAVIAGTATAVSGKVAANQATRAQQAAGMPPAPQGSPGVAASQPPASAGGAAFSDEAYQQLKKLAELRDAGILDDAEFQAKKAQILAI
jgi:hypothetical protein